MAGAAEFGGSPAVAFDVQFEGESVVNEAIERRRASWWDIGIPRRYRATQEYLRRCSRVRIEPIIRLPALVAQSNRGMDNETHRPGGWLNVAARLTTCCRAPARGYCDLRPPAVAQALLGEALDDALVAGAEAAFLLFVVKQATRIGHRGGRVLRRQ